MGLTLTARSHVPDRSVRVDRRLRVDDGAFGTYELWSTIVESYKIRLKPDATQRRERRELGEQMTDQGQASLTAWGYPSRNGRTIRQGDRFVDLVNNRCYDIVAVVRNRGRSPYSAMHRFELRLVADDCHEIEAPGYDDAEAGAGGGSGGSGQQHFIMRHFGHNEIFGWETLPYFDGMIYNLQYDDPLQLAEIAAVVAAGRRWWRYLAVLYYPHSGTLFGGLTPPLATLFNWIRDNLQFSGSATHRRYRVADTVALFPEPPADDGQKRELIAWPLISPAERAAFVAKIVELSLAPGGVLAPASGAFLDQAWLNVEEFQADNNLASVSGHGDTKESSPRLTALPFSALEAAYGEGGTWDSQRASILAFYEDLDTAFGSERYVLKNGEHRVRGGDTIPYPWCFENAWNSLIDGNSQPERWAAAQAGVAADPRNLLSIKCETASNSVVGVPEALLFWQQNGGWISFTDDDSPGGIANREAAYAEAATILATLGFPA